MTKRKSRKKTTTKKKTVKTKEVKEEKPKPEVKKEVKQEKPAKPVKTIRSLSPADFPEVGELVVGLCTKITTHGAYFTIEGYEILGQSSGFVHISELSRTWVRNIRKHVREGQKSVCRVMRVNMQRQEIDLSIRRVTESQKRETLQIHKQEQRAKGIIRSVASKLELNPESIYPILENHFGNLYSSLESARDEGDSVLIQIGIEEGTASELANAASKELERQSVELVGKLQISTYDPAGIILIKDSLIKASSTTLKKGKAVKVQVNAISAPDYQVKINAPDWKVAEKSWTNFQETVKSHFKKHSDKEPLLLSFIRE